MNLTPFPTHPFTMAVCRGWESLVVAWPQACGTAYSSVYFAMCTSPPGRS